MKIDGVEIYRFSDWDGLPIKNHLPAELKERLKTQNQWLEDGYVLKKGAKKYEMHPSVMAKRTSIYYLDSDVEEARGSNAPKNCLTCTIRRGRFCMIAGDYVGAKNCCSEWTPEWAEKK